MAKKVRRSAQKSVEADAQKVRRSAQKSGTERVVDHETGETQTTEEATWAKPCVDYTSHQFDHRNTARGLGLHHLPSSCGADMTRVTVTGTDGPRNAFIQAGSGLRYYTWQGRTLPSVTSVRNMAGQPHALVSWKIAKVCDRAVDELATLNAMLTRARRPRERVLEKNRRKEARAWLRAAHEEERDRAAAAGRRSTRRPRLGSQPRT